MMHDEETLEYGDGYAVPKVADDVGQVEDKGVAVVREGLLAFQALQFDEASYSLTCS